MQVEVSIQDVFSTTAIASELWQRWFHSWLTHLNPTLSPMQSYELSLRLTDDAEVRSLNAQFRQLDQPTDVLSFAALEVGLPNGADTDQDEPLYLGDIVISVETAAQQAAERHHSLTQELAWLTTHGLLHLLGWDHPNEAALRQMLDQQSELLQIVGLDPIDYDL